MNEVIEKRVYYFRKALEKLKSIRAEGKQKFFEDWKLQDSALRNFQIAIEAIADIGNYVISKKNLERPASYRDIVRILNQHKILPDNFSKKAYQIMGFRNIIVHEYLYLDMEKVFKNLKLIEDLEKFLGCLIKEINIRF